MNINKENLSALILAGGLGTRMKSDKPKVLHSICGKSLVEHVILNIKECQISDIGVIVGYKADLVKETLGRDSYHYFLQEKQLGTGHALMMAREFLKNKKGKLIILCGDAPLINSQIIEDFSNYTNLNNLDCCVLTAILDSPGSYGRIVRNNGKMEKIVELKDANKEEKDIKEVNSGAYIFDIEKLSIHLDELSNNNAQNEYYLTDMIEIFIRNGYNVDAYPTKNSNVIEAVNNRYELSKCEAIMREEINILHMLNGVTIIDKNTTYIDRGISIGIDTKIYPNTIITGSSKIGKNNTIYSSRISSSIIEDDNTIDTSTIIDSEVSSNVKIGPYAHLRPKSIIKDSVKLGNYVEVKNSTIEQGSKVSHLTYVGDGHIGKETNIGCGVVFVNYDGDKKALTEIGDNSFVGCNVNLVAPVKVGSNVYIAAGSTITEDIEDNAMAIARARQTNKNNWTKK